MYFDQNAEALLGVDPAIAPLLERLRQMEPTPSDDLTLVASADGQCGLGVRGIWLHNPEKPLAEAHRAFKSSCKPLADRVHLVIGMGLGYAADHAYQNSPAKIIVYEPDLPLLRFTMENVDLSELLGSGRVQLATTHFDLLTQLRPYIYSDFDLDILMLPGMAERLSEDIPGLVQAIRTMIADWARDYRTVQRFHPIWMEQFFRNFPAIAQTESIDRLADCFNGKPAVVISRGPSLDAALPDLAELADSAVLVAVGGALRALWHAGITPDFAIFYDANGQDEQLHGLPQEYLSKVTFIVCPSTPDNIYKYPSRGKFVFFSQNGRQMADWVDAALDTRQLRLEGGGTVSLIAFQLALAMGCGPIVLLGQDLAFPNNQVYAGGISLQTDGAGNMALTRSETLYAELEPMTTVPGQHGETLQTLKTYAGFIRNFESLAVKLALLPQPPRLYNASLGGAKIDGYELLPLSSFKNQWAPWKNGGPALINAPGQNPQLAANRSGKLGQAVRQLVSDIEATIHFCGMLDRQLLEQTPPKPQPANFSKTIPATPSTQDLRQIEESVWEGTQRLFLHMQQKPFVGFLAMFELIPYKQRFKAFADAESFNPEIRDDLSRTLESTARVLRDQYGRWAKDASQELERSETGQEAAQNSRSADVP